MTAQKIPIIRVAMLWIFLLSITLVWCGQAPDQATLSWDIATTWEQKQPFYVNVEKISNFSSQSVVWKNGKIQSTNDVIVSAQVAWRVRTISKKEWDKVWINTSLVRLTDSASNYALQVERSNLNVKSAVIQFEQTQIDLDTRIEDTQRALQQAKDNYEIAKAQSEQSINQALENLKNTQKNVSWSLASLTLDQTKTNLDWSLDQLQDQILAHKRSLSDYFDDVLYKSDVLLGVSLDVDSQDQTIARYVWQKNSILRIDTKIELTKLYQTYEDFQKRNVRWLSTQEYKQEIAYYFSMYDRIDLFVEAMLDVLDATITPSPEVTATVNGYITTFNWYQSQSTSLYNALVQIDTQASNLLRTVSTWVNLTDQKIAIAEKDIETQKINAEIAYKNALIQQKNSLSQSENVIKNTQATLDSLLRSKQNQLDIAQNQIKVARVWYNEAADSIKKLVVTSPINWKIEEVYVDEWQEVSPWTQLVKIVWTAKQDIVFSLTKEELSLVTQGKKVFVHIQDTIYDARISSIWAVANDNLQYTVKASLAKSVDNLWDYARVEIPVKVASTLLPIETVTLIWDGKWYVYLLSGSHDFNRQDVEVWRLRWDTIEITSPLSRRAIIITSPLQNFSPFVYELTVAWTETKQLEKNNRNN